MNPDLTLSRLYHCMIDNVAAKSNLAALRDRRLSYCQCAAGHESALPAYGKEETHDRQGSHFRQGHLTLHDGGP